MRGVKNIEDLAVDCVAARHRFGEFSDEANALASKVANRREVTWPHLEYAKGGFWDQAEQRYQELDAIGAVGRTFDMRAYSDEVAEKFVAIWRSSGKTWTHEKYGFDEEFLPEAQAFFAEHTRVDLDALRRGENTPLTREDVESSRAWSLAVTRMLLCPYERDDFHDY